MPIAVAQVAVPAVHLGPRFDLHVERFAVRCLVAGPQLLEQRGKGCIQGAWTWISWLMVRVRSSRVCRGNHRFSLRFGEFKSGEPLRTIGFRAFLHSIQLVLPVTLEGRPIREEGVSLPGVGAVQLLPALAAHPNSPTSRSTRRCLETEAAPGRGLPQSLRRAARLRQDSSKSPAGGLSNRVESIRSGARFAMTKHYIPYKNMSSVFFVWLPHKAQS